jgi:hypothetical protein
MKSRDPGVSPLLDALRDEEARVEAPSRLENAVLASWDDAHPPSRLRRFGETRRSRMESGSSWANWHHWQRAGAIAAAATLTFTLTALGGKLRTAVIPATPGGTTMVLVGEPILEGEPVRVVRMRVPASTLHALGVRSTGGEFADAVDVDVIVGEDGVARAIRVGM